MTAATQMSSARAEAALTQRLAARDEAAFRALYRAHAGLVFRIARRFCCDDADAEEVVQETFIAVFKSIDRFRGEARLSTWLYRVAVNQGLKRARWRGRRRETMDDAFDGRQWAGPSPESVVVSRQATKVLIEQCLQRVDAKKRAVLVLYELEQLNTAEIAEILQINRSTVLTRLSRGRAELRRLAEAQGII